MGKPSKPRPVKLFVGLLSSVPEILEKVEERLEDSFGKIDGSSSTIPFDYTDYYDEEMGEGIKRKFVSFENLIHPGDLAGIKLETNQIETDFSRRLNLNITRPINIDPGYIGLSKLVLATTKNYSHRIFLEDGIYAEVTLQYKGGEFSPLPWTYPDYRSSEYLDFFATTRRKYRKQMD